MEEKKNEQQQQLWNTNEKSHVIFSVSGEKKSSTT